MILHAPDLVPELRENEEIEFVAPDGEIPFTLPAPFMTDAEKIETGAVAISLEPCKALGPAWNDGGFPNLVFTHPDGSHLSQPTAWKILHKILVAAGIDAHRFHDLRHH